MWCSRSITRLVYVAACGSLALGDVGCGGGPSAPTVTSTSATLHSVVITFRGSLVESTPVTIPSPEALDAEIRLTLDVPSDSRVTVYLCVMERKRESATPRGVTFPSSLKSTCEPRTVNPGTRIPNSGITDPI